MAGAAPKPKPPATVAVAGAAPKPKPPAAGVDEATGVMVVAPKEKPPPGVFGLAAAVFAPKLKLIFSVVQCC